MLTSVLLYHYHADYTAKDLLALYTFSGGVAKYVQLFMAPYEELDLTQWFTFIFTSNKEDLNTIIEKYPLMKQKYEIIDAAMREGLGKGINEILK